MLFFFPRGVLDEILNLIESVSEGFLPTFSLVCCLVIRGSTDGFLLLRYFSGTVLHPLVLQVSQYVSVESSSPTHYTLFVICLFTVLIR